MTAIMERYEALGGPGGVLGEPLLDEVVTRDGAGWFQVFDRGTILAHPRYGAWEVVEPAASTWRSSGGESGPLGYPVGPPVELEGRRGICTPFEGGYVTAASRSRDAFVSTRPPPGLARQARFEIEVRRVGPNPVLGVLFHAYRRLVNGNQPSSRLEILLDDAGAAHQRLLARRLAGVVEAWEALPEEVRDARTPSSIAGIDVDDPVEMPSSDELLRHPGAWIAARPREASVVDQAVTTATVGQLVGLAAAGLVGTPDGPLTEVPGERHYAEVPDSSVLNDLLNALKAGVTPHIDRLEPFNGLGHQPGDPLWAIGDRFGVPKSDNTIVLFSRAPDLSWAETAVLAPKVGSATALSFELPMGLAAGYYGVRVRTSVDGIGPVESNLCTFTVGLPVPIITGVSPGNPEPGHTVVLHGENFVEKMAVQLKALEGQYAVSTYFWTDSVFKNLRYVGPNQLELDIPVLNAPGKVALRAKELMPGPGSGTYGDWFLGVDVRPARFILNYTKFYVFKESDKDQLTPDDEVIFNWVIGVDGNVWAKSTTQYGNVDTGEIKYFTGQDKQVFPPPGHNGAVRDHLWITTQMWENDAPNDGQEVIEYLGKVAYETNKVTGDPYTGAAAAFAPLISQGIGLLAKAFGLLDDLGRNDRLFEAQQLAQYTSFVDPFPLYIEFNAGAGGHYGVLQELRRIS